MPLSSIEWQVGGWNLHLPLKNAKFSTPLSAYVLHIKYCIDVSSITTVLADELHSLYNIQQGRWMMRQPWHIMWVYIGYYRAVPLRATTLQPQKSRLPQSLFSPPPLPNANYPFTWTSLYPTGCSSIFCVGHRQRVNQSQRHIQTIKRVIG